MARVSTTNSSLKDWQNGQIMNADDYKKERLVLITAINDNYDRINELEGITEIVVKKDQTFTATEGQEIFVLTTGTFPMGKNLLEVVVEGFEQIELQDFEEVSNNSFKLATPLDEGMVVYARWYEPKPLKMFTEDLTAFTIMGVF